MIDPHRCSCQANNRQDALQTKLIHYRISACDPPSNKWHKLFKKMRNHRKVSLMPPMIKSIWQLKRCWRGWKMVVIFYREIRWRPAYELRENETGWVWVWYPSFPRYHATGSLLQIRDAEKKFCWLLLSTATTQKKSCRTINRRFSWCSFDVYT